MHSIPNHNYKQNSVVLKGKCHIVDIKYKVNGFVKTVNNKIQIEVGEGNNQYETNTDDEVTYVKFNNIGDLDVKIRLSKDGKETKFIHLSPADKYNGISIFFTGKDAAGYFREAHEYIDYMINTFYDLPRLENVDYTNKEQKYNPFANKFIDD